MEEEDGWQREGDSGYKNEDVVEERLRRRRERKKEVALVVVVLG